MKEIRTNIGLIVRTIVFLYIPATLLVSVLFQALFGAAIRFQWVTLIIYLGVLIQWMISRYKHELHLYKVADMKKLEHILMANNWEIIDRRRDGLSVRPSFDRPFNFIVNDKPE